MQFSISRVWLFVTPMDCSLPGSSIHGILQARILEWVGCNSFLLGILPTQVLNLCLLNCRQTLYHLSYQGTPTSPYKFLKNVLMQAELYASGKMTLKEMAGWREIRVNAES